MVYCLAYHKRLILRRTHAKPMHVDMRLQVPLPTSRESGCCVQNATSCASILYSCEQQHCVAWCPSSQVAHHSGALHETSRLSQLTASDRRTLKLGVAKRKETRKHLIVQQHSGRLVALGTVHVSWFQSPFY